MYKGKFGGINIGASIVEMLSYNKIKITTGEEKIELKLQETILHWDQSEGALGIKGIIKTSYGDEIKIAICNDGEKIFMELFESESSGGRKIIDIETGKNKRVTIKYYHNGEKTHTVFLSDIKELLSDIRGVLKEEVGGRKKWYIKIEAVIAYINSKDPKTKGNINELCTLDMIIKLLEEDGYEIDYDKIRIVGGGVNKDIADIHIVARKNGKEFIIPVETKSFSYETIGERNLKFNNGYQEAARQLNEDFDFRNEEYKSDKCEFGFIVVNGLNKNDIQKAELDPNVEWVKVDTLILKINKTIRKKPEKICIPEGYNLPEE